MMDKTRNRLLQMQHIDYIVHIGIGAFILLAMLTAFGIVIGAAIKLFAGGC
jgi:hypothetical protein